MNNLLATSRIVRVNVTDPIGGDTMKKITRIESSGERIAARKLRVAAYCRVSTDMEIQLASLEAQKTHYEALINANPEWEFAGLYFDEGITGTKKEVRPALMKMIADCEEGRIQKVLTKSLSRFSRNTTDCLELVRKLLGIGVTIYFEKENIDTGEMESELLLTVMSSLAESESVSISENSKWGVRHRFENGTYKISRSPYGYTVKDGIFHINEEEAKWVRFIFEEAIAGKSTYRIAKDLQSMNVKSRTGAKWSSATVKAILQNEKYIGDCLFQKTYTDFRFKRHLNNGDRDQFYISDHHEPIISREEFELAERVIRQHAKEKNMLEHGEKYSSRYPFSGKIICGQCGGTFKRRTQCTGSQRYILWACREHLMNREKCSMKAIRESAIEDAFAMMMNKLIFARDQILKNLLAGIRRQNHTSSLQRINEIEKSLEAMRERKDTLTKIMAKDYLEPAAFSKETNDLAAAAASLENERDTLMRRINGDIKKAEALRLLIAYTEKAEMLTAFDAELFGRFVDHITVVSREKLVFSLKCGLNLEERIRNK